METLAGHHQPTCNAVLLLDDKQCNCGHDGTVHYPDTFSPLLAETMCRVDLGTPTLEDLYLKISGFPEMLQTDNLPMLSKASCLAQIASARALERIAENVDKLTTALECLGDCVVSVGEGEYLLKVRLEP